jgi:hypothetical protein
VVGEGDAVVSNGRPPCVGLRPRLTWLHDRVVGGAKYMWWAESCIGIVQMCSTDTLVHLCDI